MQESCMATYQPGEACLAARIYGLATLSLLLSRWHKRLPYRATVTAGGGMGGVGTGRGRRMSCGLRDELLRGKRYMVQMGSVGRTSWCVRARDAGVVANNLR
jgi:hypothetical protein